MSIRKPVGANYISDHCEFSLWAPFSREVWLELPGEDHARFRLNPGEYGYWDLTLQDLPPGTKYLFNPDNSGPRPDPASRSQPEGVHGPSEVLSLHDYSWDDEHWKNIPLPEYIIYELHTGTFTPRGDFEGIISKLGYLADLGITAIELMPVATFTGERNWGYDGVYPFAVQHSYGGPHGLMKLVDACHNRGLALILDVVYNHLGPEGNYLASFGPYFTSKYHTPWGKAVNFDDRYSDGFRNYVVQNALMWFRDFHIDALRLDAVHAIFDISAKHIMQELAEETARINLETGRNHYLIAESDLNNTRYITPLVKGGYGLDAQWSDDFHHSLHALVTGEKDGYYADFGDITQLEKAFSSAFVFDGKYSGYRKRTFGSETGENPASRFVVFAQNHDQTGNRKNGERLSTLVGFETLKLVAGTVLTSPFLPLLFMGEEYGETRPFLYFVSHLDPGLNTQVREGRQKELAAFYENSISEIDDPSDEETFLKSKLSWNQEADEHAKILERYYRTLISLRKNHPVFSIPDKNNLQTSCSGKLLKVHRWQKESTVWCFYNFGTEPESITIPVTGENTFRKLIDSSGQEWLGPGNNSPDIPGKHERIRVNGNSMIIYTTS